MCLIIARWRLQIFAYKERPTMNSKNIFHLSITFQHEIILFLFLAIYYREPFLMFILPRKCFKKRRKFQNL